jgi:hypothetical protein
MCFGFISGSLPIVQCYYVIGKFKVFEVLWLLYGAIHENFSCRTSLTLVFVL